MKNLVFLAAIASLFYFAACQKESLNPVFETSDLSVTDRDSTNNCMNGDTISVDSLSQAVLDYVTANYPNDKIVGAVVKKKGKITAVELSNGTVLIFSKSGKFLKICGEKGGNGGGGHGGNDPNPGPHGNGGCLGGDTLTVDQLPAPAADYVAANYPTQTVQTVVSRSTKSGKTIYAAELTDGTVLIFSAEGEFVKICEGKGGNGGTDPNPGPTNDCMDGDELALDQLPTAITDFITTKFPDDKAVAAVSQNNGKRIAVELSNGKVLIFSAEGKFLKLCGEKGDGNGGNGHGG